MDTTATTTTDDWQPDRLITYRFQSDYAEIVFNVPVMKDWEEERVDDCALTDLRSYVQNPQDYWLDDCWDCDIEAYTGPLKAKD